MTLWPWFQPIMRSFISVSRNHLSETPESSKTLAATLTQLAFLWQFWPVPFRSSHAHLEGFQLSWAFHCTRAGNHGLGEVGVMPHSAAQGSVTESTSTRTLCPCPIWALLFIWMWGCVGNVYPLSSFPCAWKVFPRGDNKGHLRFILCVSSLDHTTQIKHHLRWSREGIF